MMMEDATFFDMDDGLNTLPQQVQKIADTTSTPFTVSYSPPAPVVHFRHSSPPRAVPVPAPAPVAAPAQVETTMVASTSKTTSTQQTGIHRWLAAHRPYLPHDQPSSTSLAVPTTTSSSSKSTRSGRLLPVHNSTPTSAFSDSEDDDESSDEFEEEEEDDEEEYEERQYFGRSSFLPRRRESGEESSSDNSSEEEAEEEMIFLRPRRSHGSRPASTQRPTVSTPSPIQQQQQRHHHVRRRTPPMPLSLSAQRPALPIVDLAQASGTSSFDQPELAVIISTPTHSIPPPLHTAASSLPKSHWSDDEDDEEEEEEEEEVESIIDGEEALWLVVPPEDDLPALDADYEDATNDAPSTSTRSLPIPISLPLDHYRRTLTVDEQQLPLEVCVQKTKALPPAAIAAAAVVAQQLRREKEEEECGQSPPGHYRTSRLVFQRGQSFYKPWLDEYIHQPHHRHS
ncbi:hypothetical protein FS842_000762 [Serendipita sp. 407]|nr:hypothetical protein FS842_000762 [Serendipita sp. 407]